MTRTPAALFAQRWQIAALLAVLTALLLGGRSAEAAPRAVQGGTLDWGIKTSFRTYITGSIAHGAIAVTGGASRNGESFRFQVQPGGSFDSATGTLTVSMVGGVHFTGHDGTLDMTVSNLRVQLTGAGGTLMADVFSKSTTGPTNFPGVALVNLTSGVPSANATGATWTGITSSLSPTGAPAFGGFYQAGTAFDPLSFNLLLAADTTAATGAGQQTVAPTPVPFIPQQQPFVPQVFPQMPVQPFVPAPVPQTAAPLPLVAPTPVTLAPAPSTQAIAPQAPAPAPAAPPSTVRPPATGDAGLLAQSSEYARQYQLHSQHRALLWKSWL